AVGRYRPSARAGASRSRRVPQKNRSILAVEPPGRHSGPIFHAYRKDSAPFKTGGESRMKESHGKDPASHPDPESCVGGRKDAGEAWTGARAAQQWSWKIRPSGGPTRLSWAKGNPVGGATGKPPSAPAQSETLRMRGNSSHGKRETPRAPAGGKAGRSEKVEDRASGAHARGKSDGCVVPKRPPNRDGQHPPTGAAEGRRPTEGNTNQENACR